MAASKKKAKPSKSSLEIKALRTKFAHLKKKYGKLAVEKNFLEKAMFRVKERGGNNFEIFSEELLTKMN
jgi:hypothetical protein